MVPLGGVRLTKCLNNIRKHLLRMKYQKRQNFGVSSNSTGKCSKLRPVLRFRVTQKAALIWNMTVYILKDLRQFS